MLDGNSSAELQHDTDASRAIRARDGYLSQALDDIVDRVLCAQPRRPLDLQDFLEDQADLHELVSSAWLQSDFAKLRDTLEARLRSKLEDSDAVLERAEELAEDEGREE